MSATRKRTCPTDNGSTSADNAAPPVKRNLSTCTRPAPFSHEPEAMDELEHVDYTQRITKEMAEQGTATRPVRVYADGIYDMFHSGHARQLMQAKCCFPRSQVYLIVGICNDALTHHMKGRTVMNEPERYEAVRHCRYVDEVVADAPWQLDDDFLQRHKIDFVAHDDLPYGAGDEDDIYKWIKDKGMFVATCRTPGISTTDVIARIIKDYDLYIRRNLQRGYSAKDLNVGYMKAKSIQFNMRVNKMKEKMDDKRKEVLDKGNEMIARWEERSREFIGNFMDFFSGDNKLKEWLNESRSRVARAISPTRMLEQPVATGASTSALTSSSPPSSPSAKRRHADNNATAVAVDNEYSDDDDHADS